MNFSSKKFVCKEFFSTFAIPSGNNAEIAQLVERNLAKVEVAGPSPVFRSSERCFKHLSFFVCRTVRGLGPPRGRREAAGGNVNVAVVRLYRTAVGIGYARNPVFDIENLK